MNRSIKISMLYILILGLQFSITAKEGKIELETLKIQGNKELPKMLFIVPWKTNSNGKSKTNHQKLVLHSLYGDLFDPITPNISTAQSKKKARIKMN